MDRLASRGILLLYTGTAIVDAVDHSRATIAAQLNDTDVELKYREIDSDIFGDSLLEASLCESGPHCGGAGHADQSS